MFRIDARIPVRFGPAATAGPEEAVLAEGVDFASGLVGHAPDCSCCVARSGAARALAELFQRRARGEVPFFRGVLVDGGEAEVRQALEADPLAAAWFRVS